MKRLIMTLLFLALCTPAMSQVFDPSYQAALNILRPRCSLITEGGMLRYDDSKQQRPAPTIEELIAVDVLTPAQIARKRLVWQEMADRMDMLYTMRMTWLIRGYGTQAQNDAMDADLLPIWQDAKQARIDIEALETVAEVKAFTW